MNNQTQNKTTLQNIKLPFRSQYSPRIKITSNTEGISLTKQSFKDESDINNVLKKYRTNGQMPVVNEGIPQYGDYSSIPNYQEALNTVINAQNQFNQLDATIRDRFNNNPQQFLDFVSNPKNLDEMCSLGIATKKIADAPEIVQNVPKAKKPQKESEVNIKTE